MKLHFIFLNSWIVLLLRGTANGYVTKKVLMKTFGQCHDEPSLPVELSDFRISQKQKGEYFLTGFINVTKDLPAGWLYKMEVYKCKDIHNFNLCEIYLDRLKTEDGCTIFYGIKLVYSDELSNYMHPTMECEAKAGIYKIEDCPLKKNLESILSYASGASVTVKIQGFSNDTKLFCINTRFDITNRRHNSQVVIT